MTSKRPALTQVFPDPLTQQWPSTSNPVFCECQQLYALVSLCCCVSGTHLLVLHEGPSTNMLTAMPRGPKYVDFKISQRTSADDLASFLVRANKAAGVVSGGRWDTARVPHGAGASTTESPFSPRSAHAPSAFSTFPSGAPAAETEERKVVVVCIRGLASAPPEVLGLLMDALLFGCVAQTRSRRSRAEAGAQRRSPSPLTPTSPPLGTAVSAAGSRAAASGQARASAASSAAAATRRHEHTVMIPCVRIIAFCSAQSYAVLLPDSFRAAFDLSLFMSRVAMESAAVLQSGDASKSNVVHRANMLELANSIDGDSLADTVTCSVVATRYLRHLLLVLRGSTFNMDSLGTYGPRKLNRFVHLLRAMTILFAPDDADPVTARSRWALRLRHPTHSRLFSGGAGGPANDDDSDETDESASDDPSGRGRDPSLARPKKPPTSYAHLVVTSATVMCLFPSFVAHLPTVSRYVTPHADVIQASQPLLKAMSGGRPALAASFVSTRPQPGVYAPGFWDARMVTQSSMLLRNGAAYAMVARALADNPGINVSDLTTVNANSWAAPSNAAAPVDADNPVLAGSRLFGPLAGIQGVGAASQSNPYHGAASTQMPEDLTLHINRLLRNPAALAATNRLLPRGLGLTAVLTDRPLHGTALTLRPNAANASLTNGGLGDTYHNLSTGMAFGEQGGGDDAGSSMARSHGLGAMGLTDEVAESSNWDVLHYNEVRELIRAVIIARTAPAPG